MWGFGKPELVSNPPYTAAFERQAAEDEQIYDIKHVGAVININIIRKEDTLMVERLLAYRRELEAKKAEIINIDYTDSINIKTAEYRDSLVKATEIQREADIAKVDSDIDCINVLIEREAALAEATTANTDNIE